MQKHHSNARFHFSTSGMLQASITPFLKSKSILLFAIVMLACELYMVGHASTTTTVLLHTTQHTHIHALMPHHIAEGPGDSPLAEGSPDAPFGLSAQLLSR